MNKLKMVNTFNPAFEMRYIKRVPHMEAPIERAETESGLGFFRGLIVGLLLAVVTWAGVYVGIELIWS